MGDNIYIDDNLNCSDEPTATRPVSDALNAYIEVVVPDVEITGVIPPLFQESDSVSTFRSKKKDKSVARGSVTFDTPTDNNGHSLQSEKSTFNVHASSNAVSDVNKDVEDGSVSKLSDTASKLSAFEDRFNSVTEDIAETFEEFRQTQTEQRELLTTILKHLQLTQLTQTPNQSLNLNSSPVYAKNNAETTEAVDRQSSISSDQANHLSQLNESGDPKGVAGNDS
jgi:hypothetical protein